MLTAEPAVVVVVAEDDEGVRTLIVKILTKAGYKVLGAQDAAEAAKIAQGTQVDLLIADVVMPGRNGEQLAEQFESAQPPSAVLLISGYLDDETLLPIIRPERYHDGHFLRKPFGPTELLAAIDRIFKPRAESRTATA